MAKGDDSLKEELLETDEEFRHLVNEHQESEARLEKLQQRSMLSPEDEVEEKQLKLHKLYLKDQMEQILRKRREARVSA
jgi:uncharacterized protein YdcH (DUF465 family)